MIETKEPEIYQETNPKTAPSKRWRNWWRATDSGWHDVTGAIIRPGDAYEGRCLWPSKEVAHQKAIDADAACPDASIYLGAFPEGERL